MGHTPETRRRALEKMKALRRVWLEENGPCTQCGSNENLEVDHIDPTTKVSHNVWSWSEHRRAEELSKCQVLCRTCHTEKSASNLRKHPSSSAYDRGCRCELCRKIKTDKQRVWRLKRFGSNTGNKTVKDLLSDQQ